MVHADGNMYNWCNLVRGTALVFEKPDFWKLTKLT